MSSNSDLGTAYDSNLINTKGWTPFYLRRGTLMFFIFIEAMIIAGLVLLYEFDQRKKDLATTDHSRHYFWTYGPTATSDTLLLDYESMFLPLLAGSQMLKEILPGSEFITSDAELAETGVFKGSLFSLGWWGENTETSRFGIDVGKSSFTLDVE
ncbi:hypothetical protein F4810DRAFT_714189 [Camillea tinctor]|nr:hypothetical protein F4810DRAFT_714189 [Camillea tinctor]